MPLRRRELRTRLLGFIFTLPLVCSSGLMTITTSCTLTAGFKHQKQHQHHALLRAAILHNIRQCVYQAVIGLGQASSLSTVRTLGAGPQACDFVT